MAYKASFLMSLARQVEGEMVFVNVVKAHEDPDKLYGFLRRNELPRTANIGGFDCVIEYGVIEGVEVETSRSDNSERKDEQPVQPA